MTEFGTSRPLNGTVGHLFATEGPYEERLFEILVNHLDQGEGWTEIIGNTLTWYTGQLNVVVDVKQAMTETSRAFEYADTSIVILENVQVISPSLDELLNEANSKSAGWIAWLNTDDHKVRFSIRTVLEKSNYWWFTTLLDVLPRMLAAADASVERFLEISDGTVPNPLHPKRGQREKKDTWIEGVQLGPIEPCASLDLPLTSLDLQQMKDVLENKYRNSEVHLASPLLVQLLDGNGAIFAQLREHWHSDFGLGWQYTALEPSMETRTSSEDGLPAEMVASVAEQNMILMNSVFTHPIMGGWVVVHGFGIVQHMFLPSTAIERWIADARATFGYAAGLSLFAFESHSCRDGLSIELEGDVEEHNQNYVSQTSSLEFTSGAFVRSIVVPTIDQPIFGTWDREDFDLESQKLWLVPKHIRICNFGVFNPSGPTVDSLEVGFDGRTWTLYSVLRHPFGRQIDVLGYAESAEVTEVLPQLVTDAIENLSYVPQWMHLCHNRFEQSVVDGLQKLALTIGESELVQQSREIIASGLNPWTRLNISGQELSDIDIEDPVHVWIELVTDLNVIAGFHHFIRGIWEASKPMARGDVQEAQNVVGFIDAYTHERINADFQFRGSDGLKIQYGEI